MVLPNENLEKYLKDFEMAKMQIKTDNIQLSVQHLMMEFEELIIIDIQLLKNELLENKKMLHEIHKINEKINMAVPIQNELNMDQLQIMIFQTMEIIYIANLDI